MGAKNGLLSVICQSRLVSCWCKSNESPMRRKQTFLLTIFPSEEREPALRGRLELISTGTSYTFNNLAELQRLIESSICAEQSSPTSPQICESKASYQPRSSFYPGHCEDEV